MPQFRYRALDARKQRQQGVIWGSSQQHALHQLQSRGLQHVFLSSPPVWQGWLERLRPASRQEQSICCRQLAIMVTSGIPLNSGLEILLRQPLHPGLYDAYSKAHSAVQGGNSFSQGLRGSASYFGDLYIGLVQVGERTGSLSSNLHQIAAHLEREGALRAKVRAALTYPLIVTGLSLLLAYVMVQHLLPRFLNGLFKDSGVALPWFTRLLVGITQAFQNPAAMLAAAGILALGAYLTWRQFASASGQVQLYEGLMRWGPTRRFFGTILAVRTARMLATCTEAGLPAVPSLELTARACGNPYLAHHLQVAIEDIKDGNSLSRSIRAIPCLPHTLSAFVELGEEVAGLPRVLKKAAELMESEVEETIATFTQLLEPLLVGALGLFVGFVLIALFIPIYQMLGAS